MDHLLNLVTHNKEWVRDVDVVNQLHHLITVYALISFSIMVGVKTYTVGILDCYSTNISSKYFQEHVNAYCWSHELYNYPKPDDRSQVPYPLNPLHGGRADPTSPEVKEIKDINFYRWISVIFLCQVIMFTLPRTLWIQCMKYSGIQMERIMALSSDKSAKEEDFIPAANDLDVYLKISRKVYSKSSCCSLGPSSKICIFYRECVKIGHHILLCIGAETRICLLTSHCLVKVLFLTNLVLQFIIMSDFLGFNYWTYGSEFLKNLDSDGDVNFPRLCLCHFRAQGSGSWVQCLLTINMLLEKIFVIEWFWLWILFAITTLNLIVWGYNIYSEDVARNFVEKYMPDLRKYIETSKGKEIDQATKTFVDDYLCRDGVFMLRIIAANTNDVVMTHLVKCLWELHWPKPALGSINGSTNVDTLIQIS